MSDTRTRVPLNGKKINLAQLAAEVGAPLTADETEVVADDVTATTLTAAVEKHTPAPVAPSLADRLAAVEARLDKAATAAVTGEAAKLRDNLKPAT